MLGELLGEQKCVHSEDRGGDLASSRRVLECEDRGENISSSCRCHNASELVEGVSTMVTAMVAATAVLLVCNATRQTVTDLLSFSRDKPAVCALGFGKSNDMEGEKQRVAVGIQHGHMSSEHFTHSLATPWSFQLQTVLPLYIQSKQKK